MGKRIAWSQPATADLRAIDQPVAIQILKTLARYVATGEGDVKKLQGVEPPLLRLRAQDHRIFFRARARSQGRESVGGRNPLADARGEETPRLCTGAIGAF
jgi:hypothetical protein